MLGCAFKHIIATSVFLGLVKEFTVISIRWLLRIKKFRFQEQKYEITKLSSPSINLCSYSDLDFLVYLDSDLICSANLYCLLNSYFNYCRWLVLSKLLVSLLEERPLGSNSQPRYHSLYFPNPPFFTIWNFYIVGPSCLMRIEKQRS